MPFALVSQSGSYVTLPASPRIEIPGSSPFKIGFKFRMSSVATEQPILSLSSNVSLNFIIISGSSKSLIARLVDSNTILTSSPLVADTDYEVVIERTGASSLVSTINGVQSSTASNSSAASFDRMMIRGSVTASSGFKLYYLTVEVNNVVTSEFINDIDNTQSTLQNKANGAITGTLTGYATDGSQWEFYDDGGGASTYDAGGQSSFGFSAAGGAALTANAGGLSSFSFELSGGQSAALNAGAGSQFAFESAGGAAILASCGAASEFNFDSAGGVTVDFVAGSESQFSIISTGGAEVVSDGSQTYDAGGASSFNVSSTGGSALIAVVAGHSMFDFASAGGVALIAGAGAVSEIEIITLGGAAIIANAGGVSIFSVTSVGGATVNEQSVIIDRITFPVSRIEQRLTMPRSSVLKSITIPAAISSRAVL